MITMLLGGLWHGASWTFVAWGALHGLLLAAERMFKSNGRKLMVVHAANHESVQLETASLAPAFLGTRRFKHAAVVLFTFVMVNITWVFFRATDFTSAGNILGAMFGVFEERHAVLQTIDMIKVVVVTTSMFILHQLLRQTSIRHLLHRTHWVITGILWAFLLALIVFSQKSSDSFIYFQF